jgi:hypothetical protein
LVSKTLIKELQKRKNNQKKYKFGNIRKVARWVEVDSNTEEFMLQYNFDSTNIDKRDENSSDEIKSLNFWSITIKN